MKYEVWPDIKHTRIIAEYVIDGVTYIDVIFESGNGQVYTYIKE